MSREGKKSQENCVLIRVRRNFRKSRRLILADSARGRASGCGW